MAPTDNATAGNVTAENTELLNLIALWRAAADELVDFLDGIDEEDFDRPTDLPGWDVRAVAAHVAHLESLLSGGPMETAEVPPAPHITGPMGEFTEIGVVNRRTHTGAQITAEIRDRVARRHDMLIAEPPTDPTASAPGIFGSLGWTMRTLLRNRPLDLWLHDLDVRRALGRPADVTAPAAVHVADYLAESLGFVLGKKLKAAPGTTVTLDIDGRRTTATVGEDGRGRLLGDSPAGATVIATDRESFVLRAAGRSEVPVHQFDISGDREIALRVISALAVTP